MVNTQTLDLVRSILEEHALGLGLTVADLRRLYPRKEVRRQSILEAVAHFEDLQLVRARTSSTAPTRWRWTGPIRDTSRPFGIPMRRMTRYLSIPPSERVSVLNELSRELVPPTRRDAVS